MKKVKNIAKPIKTWFGGICCVASEVLTKDKMMTILVKLVIKMSILGANDKTVNNNNNFTDVEIAEGSELENILINSSILIFLLFLLILYRSEEHTSELHSRCHIVCCFLLYKRKRKLC